MWAFLQRRERYRDKDDRTAWGLLCDQVNRVEARESTEVAAAGDQAAGALGVGVAEPGPVSVVLGTSGVVFATLPRYEPDAQARVHVF